MKTMQTHAVGIQALYTIKEILSAGVLTISQQALRRLLEKKGVEYVTIGRTKYIPLTELESKVPEFWAAYLRAVRWKADVE